MAKHSLLNITPSWISHRDPEREFTDIDLVDSLQNYFMQLKGGFALMSDHLDEQGNDIAAGFALRCEGQVTEAEKLLSYWYSSKRDNADDKHSSDDLPDPTPSIPGNLPVDKVSLHDEVSSQFRRIQAQLISLETNYDFDEGGFSMADKYLLHSIEAVSAQIESLRKMVFPLIDNG